MDIITRQVLEYIQREKKNTILAGGSVRDSILNLPPKDYDIFMPIEGRRDLMDTIRSLDRDLGISAAVDRTGTYESMINNIRGVWNFEFEGKIFDIIGIQLQDDEEFPEEVLKSFDYGINMVYDNGSFVEDSNEHFQYDLRNNTMTLIRLQHIEQMDDSIKRFNSFNKKLRSHNQMERTFRSTCLSISDSKVNNFEVVDTRTTRPWSNGILNDHNLRAQQIENNHAIIRRWGEGGAAPGETIHIPMVNAIPPIPRPQWPVDTRLDPSDQDLGMPTRRLVPGEFIRPDPQQQWETVVLHSTMPQQED